MANWKITQFFLEQEKHLHSWLFLLNFHWPCEFFRECYLVDGSRKFPYKWLGDPITTDIHWTQVLRWFDVGSPEEESFSVASLKLGLGGVGWLGGGGFKYFPGESDSTIGVRILPIGGGGWGTTLGNWRSIGLTLGELAGGFKCFLFSSRFLGRWYNLTSLQTGWEKPPTRRETRGNASIICDVEHKVNRFRMSFSTY